MVNACVSVFIMCMHVVCLFIFMCGYLVHVYMCMCVRMWCVYVYKCIFVWVYVFGCVVQCFRTACEIRTRFGFVFAEDPIHRRFEDRPMGWLGDPYRFIQWRADGNSDPKSRHFMWVFIFVSLLLNRYQWLFTLFFNKLNSVSFWSCSDIVMLVNYYSRSYSLRWYLFQSSSIWD